MVSYITLSTLKSTIRSPEDLQRFNVATWEVYTEKVKESLDIRAIALPWNCLEDEQEMLRKLKGREIDVLVLDRPWVLYHQAHDKDCELRQVPLGNLASNFHHIVFPPGSSSEDMNQVVLSLTRLQDTSEPSEFSSRLHLLLLRDHSML